AGAGGTKGGKRQETGRDAKPGPPGERRGRNGGKNGRAAHPDQRRSARAKRRKTTWQAGHTRAGPGANGVNPTKERARAGHTRGSAIAGGEGPGGSDWSRNGRQGQAPHTARGAPRSSYGRAKLGRERPGQATHWSARGPGERRGEAGGERAWQAHTGARRRGGATGGSGGRNGQGRPHRASWRRGSDGGVGGRTGRAVPTIADRQPGGATGPTSGGKTGRAGHTGDRRRRGSDTGQAAGDTGRACHTTERRRRGDHGQCGSRSGQGRGTRRSAWGLRAQRRRNGQAGTPGTAGVRGSAGDKRLENWQGQPPPTNEAQRRPPRGSTGRIGGRKRAGMPHPERRRRGRRRGNRARKNVQARPTRSWSATRESDCASGGINGQGRPNTELRRRGRCDGGLSGGETGRAGHTRSAAPGEPTGEAAEETGRAATHGAGRLGRSRGGQ
ncbi:collagen alpha-1(I) chain-like, partial [Gigantopelta aegis]|uniref:collagen alpha-1(I) chain-like n=1 Tax=Gigantopelta aegis TaxID=1735272 RepID=UPI001B889E92